MHNFEFLRMVNIGQYLPLQSVLHRLDPRARILIYFCIIAAATFTSSPLGLAVALAVTFIGFWFGRILAYQPELIIFGNHQRVFYECES